jgi:amino acid adenylation domain-containing protein
METHIGNSELMQINNANIVPYENKTCIHEKLEQTAQRFPDRCALSYEKQTMTYSELDRQSNAVANKLLLAGIGIEDFVLVYLDRSIELMVSIFGTLKAGGVYVPVNKEVPKERIVSILEDTQASIVITSRSYAGNIPEGPDVVYIDEFLSDKNSHNTSAPKVDIKSNNLAYAIFTSGSTGKPKGVLIEHHSVMNRIGWMQKQFPITTDDVLLQKTPITFDVSIWELFWWSFVGASLSVLPETYEKNPERLFSTIHDAGVTVIHFVPSMLNVSLGYLRSHTAVNYTKSLRWVFSSGEALMSATVSEFYKINSRILSNKATLVNLYGPTEATVDVSYFICHEPVPDEIPIGKPIDNTQLYIIDEKHQILPANEEGELVICGVNLARGYLNRDVLNQEKFVTLVVGNTQVRAYKTGDKAFYNANGDIIYKGRFDFQVKLRGYRIELTEIENVTLQHPEIVDCACVVVNEGTVGAEIICYYTCSCNNIQEKSIFDFLSKKLPGYMIPSQFINLPSLPRIPSGKIDRKALINHNNVATTVFEEEEPVEEKLKKIWGGLLKKEISSVSENFFDLGGNSIMIIQMTMLIQKEMGISIDVIELFQYTTIQSLAAFIKKSKE